MNEIGIIASAANIGAGGGGGGGPYIASAVHFDPASTVLHNSSFQVADSSLVSESVWFFIADIEQDGDFNLLNIDNDNLAIGSFAGFNNRQIGYAWADAAFENYKQSRSAVNAFTFGAWHNLLTNYDMNHAAGSRISRAWLDDEEIDINVDLDESGGPFQIPFNGRPVDFVSPIYPTLPVADFVDLWLGFGQFIDFSVEANRRKFIDANGKPVYLGANGELPTGTAPAVFFSGDATGFATNRGTGGAFTLTGTLTNASTSPSD